MDQGPGSRSRSGSNRRQGWNGFVPAVSGGTSLADENIFDSNIHVWHDMPMLNILAVAGGIQQRAEDTSFKHKSWLPIPQHHTGLCSQKRWKTQKGHECHTQAVGSRICCYWSLCPGEVGNITVGTRALSFWNRIPRFVLNSIYENSIRFLCDNFLGKKTSKNETTKMATQKLRDTLLKI